MAGLIKINGAFYALPLTARPPSQIGQRKGRQQGMLPPRILFREENARDFKDCQGMQSNDYAAALPDDGAAEETAEETASSAVSPASGRYASENPVFSGREVSVSAQLFIHV